MKRKEFGKSAMDVDRQILDLALREMSKALSTLIAECLDDAGKPKEPSQQAIMRARGMLPPYLELAFSKKRT